MVNVISNAFNTFINLMKTFSVSDVLDIVVMSFLIYSVVKLIRETRAEQLLKGLFILVFAWFIATQLHLKILGTVLNNFFQFTVLALLVVFQPELRKALEQIGRTNIGRYWDNTPVSGKGSTQIDKIINCIGSVSDACSAFSRTGTGALIVFEKNTKLGDIIDTGTVLNAEVSAQLIGNIFFNKAPLHDGAIIIKDSKIYAAGCILPLTENDDLGEDLGTRHRAAVGISEISDAIVIIVSEETGAISIAVSGVITRNYSRETLYKYLKYNLAPNVDDGISLKSIITPFRRKRKNEK